MFAASFARPCVGRTQMCVHLQQPHKTVFNRPGVAGAVLQSPPLLINWFIHPLVQISSKHCQSQTGRARELTFWENVHPKLCVMCHVSHVTCHLSPVKIYKKGQNSFFGPGGMKSGIRWDWSHLTSDVIRCPTLPTPPGFFWHAPLRIPKLNIESQKVNISSNQYWIQLSHFHSKSKKKIIFTKGYTLWSQTLHRWSSTPLVKWS